MKTVSIREMRENLDELVHDVEQGETVVVTRDGKPLFNLVPSEDKPEEKKGGINWEAMQAQCGREASRALFPISRTILTIRCRRTFC